MSGRHKVSQSSALIPWHPAFCEAIRMDLEPWKDVLEFKFEYALTEGPLKIDALIIRKLTGTVIEGNIAALFRENNILEYKSPAHYISVDNFYKVYGYACFYASLEKEDIASLTISLVGSHHPGKLLRHLRKERGYRVEEAYSGIYHVTGDIMPIQIVETGKLSAEEHLWLNGLSDNLDISRADSIIKESLKKGQDARMRAYLGTLLLANPQVIKEVVRMRNGTLTLEKALEETGLTEKWKTEGKAEGIAEGKAEGIAEGIAEGEARGKAEGKAEGEAAGREEKALEIARNLIRKGWSAQEIAETINLGLDKIKPLYRAQGQRTPKTR